MSTAFEQDEYPSRPKILFVGLGESSHTHGWIDLLSDAKLNVRLFAMPSGVPPESWATKTYVTVPVVGSDTGRRRYLYAGAAGRLRKLYHRAARALHRSPPDMHAWLAQVIRDWRPDIVHTLGLFDDQGGEFYLETRRRHSLQGHGKWVLQVRGGSDMALRRFDPIARATIERALTECDQVVCDNTANVGYMHDMGIDVARVASITPVPGSGGIAVGESIPCPPSQRERIIIWPKAYESRWSKALPVLEALQLAWEAIAPCQIHLLATTPEVRQWVASMPEHIRARFHIADRIPRDEVLDLMRRARVMLAPSLIDGVPNSLYEAMAYGAFPIISPLDTIRSLPITEPDVLFARNLYPHEIADGLRRAMTDDGLIDRAAARNHAFARTVVNRSDVRARVVEYYHRLVPR